MDAQKKTDDGMVVEEKPEGEAPKESDFSSLAAPAEVISVPPPAKAESGRPAGDSGAQESAAAVAEKSDREMKRDPDNVRALRKEDALRYLELVKTRFADRTHVYNTFLDIMKDFKHDAISTPDVIQRVTELFVGYPDLIEGFGTFLPAGYKMPSAKDQQFLLETRGQPKENPEDYRQTVEFDHAITYVNKIKMRFLSQPEVYKQFLEILHRYQSDQESSRARSNSIFEVYDQVASLFSEHQDLLDEFCKFLPEPIAEKAPGYVPTAKQRKTPGIARPPSTAAPGIMAAKKPKVKPAGDKIRKPAKAPGVRPVSEVPQPAPEITFFENLKARLNNEQLYNDFIKCVHLYNIGVLSNIDTYVLSHDILTVHDDLHDEFRNIFKIPYHFPYEFDASTFQMPPELEEKVSPPVAEPDDALAVANLPPVAAPAPVAPVEPKPVPVPSAVYDVFTSPQVQPPTGRALVVGADVDYNTCKRFGPSYRLLPRTFQQPRCSGRTELAKSVLNDVLVSVPTGTEGEEGGYKSHKKNPFEESIFKCEDERFELDMMVHINNSALRVLEPAVKRLHTEQEEPFVLGLQSHHYRLIERLYGDHGKEVVRELKKNPAALVEIVLKRLRQKDVEWRRQQKDWNTVWREGSRHNYYRALDVLSFHFKSRDRKALTQKSIISELESLLQKEKRLAPRRSPPKFQVKSRMDDDSLLTDIVELLNLSADKTLASRPDREKALRFVAVLLNQLIKSSNDAPIVTDKDADEEYGLKRFTNKDVPALASRSRVIFVNSAIVVFVRLFMILYDRLSEAKALCESANEKREALLSNLDGDASKLPLLDPHLPIVVQGPVMRPIVLDPESGFPIEGVLPIKGMEVTPKPSLPATPYPDASPAPESRMDVEEPAAKPFTNPTGEPKLMTSPPPFNQGCMPGPLFRAYVPPITIEISEDEIENRYGTTLEQVKTMIGTGHDAQKLEDKLRFLLGPNSYVLFGMDRLLQQIVRQASVCASSDLSKKLIGLYVYHQSPQEQQTEYQYRTNVMKLIPEDESCFRCELNATVGMQNSTAKELMRVLYVGIVDSTAPSAVDPRSLEERWATYMSQYLMSDTVLIDPASHHVFLKRSLKREAPSDDGESERIKKFRPEDNMIVKNGLECTEDFMYRKRSLSTAKIATQRAKAAGIKSSKFSNFIRRRVDDKAEVPWKRM